MATETATNQVDVVQLQIKGRHGQIVISNPPVNALSISVRTGIINCLYKAQSADIDLLILMGDFNNFVSGSDLKEFDIPLMSPSLPDVIAAIENCRKPIIAAIDGAAFGGGLELALACDGRIASERAVLALPEGNFGIIPGAGGIPRAVRVASADVVLDLVSSCRQIGSREALEIGLIDRVSNELIEASVSFAYALNGCKRSLGVTPVKSVESSQLSEAITRALKRGRNRPYAIEQVASVKRALERPFEEALSLDRSAFMRLRDSDESASLQYLFFAEREAMKIPSLLGVKSSQIRHVGVVGAGTMGTGIAAAFLGADIPVILTDKNNTILQRSIESISGLLLTPSKIGNLETSQELADLKDCDLVIEAAYEDLSVKIDLLKNLDTIVRSDTILATNTSYLDLNVMASAIARPERFVGLHFFAPAHIMKLLEIVRADKTSLETLATAFSVSRRLRKTGVVSRVCEGFIGNRIYNSYRQECEAMLRDGASPEQIDTALVEFGFSMGPFSVSDLSGLDIAWANRSRNQRLTGDNSDFPVLEWLVAAGRLGRKSGAGWYRYANGNKVPDPAVDALIKKARNELGIVPIILSSEEIQYRALAAIVNESLLVLEDRIAERASDIDLVFVNGYGFPKHFGGPLRWAAMQDRNKIALALDSISRAKRAGNLSLLSLK